MSRMFGFGGLKAHMRILVLIQVWGGSTREADLDSEQTMAASAEDSFGLGLVSFDVSKAGVGTVRGYEMQTQRCCSLHQNWLGWLSYNVMSDGG